MPECSPPHVIKARVSYHASSGLPVGKALKDVERDLILQTLELVRGNRLRAAEILGISPKTLYNKLGRYQSEGEKFQTRSAVVPPR